MAGAKSEQLYPAEESLDCIFIKKNATCADSPEYTYSGFAAAPAHIPPVASELRHRCGPNLDKRRAL